MGHGGDVERLLAGVGGQRLVAGVAQDDAQRAQDLRLVVADEDLLASAPAGGGHDGAPVTSAVVSRPVRSATGSETRKLVPWPGRDSTVIEPPLASTNPLTIANPNPEPVDGEALALRPR